MRPSAGRLTILGVLGVAALILAGSAVASLQWRYVHDSPLMIYAGFLIDRGAVPYRDFFDMNMPGTYFVMWTMGQILGWTDLAFRVFDLSLLAILSFATFLWMRPMGGLSATYAAIAFPLYYLTGGATVSMQREYIALLPLAFVLWLSCRGTTSRPVLRGFLVGVLSAAAFLIKPQFALLCLPALIFLIQEERRTTGIPRFVMALSAGFFLPCGATLWYLTATGGLAPFLDIATNYWPLYTHMNGDHEPIAGASRAIYIVKSLWDGLKTPVLPPALLGILVGSRDSAMRRQSWLTGTLLLAATLYPALSGQFWDYHWIPFHYMTLCAASLAVRPSSLERNKPIGRIAFAASTVLLFFVSALPGLGLYWLAQNRGAQLPLKSGVPDGVHQFLSTHLRPGDTVQPLDWTGGAVHGMLMARAPLATRFIYDFHFYHHVESSPYIHRLRKEFMRELSEKKPRFIIQVLEDKPWPKGADTTRSFPELEAYLARHYSVVKEERTYRILERGHAGRSEGV